MQFSYSLELIKSRPIILKFSLPNDIWLEFRFNPNLAVD